VAICLLAAQRVEDGERGAAAQLRGVFTSAQEAGDVDVAARAETALAAARSRVS
jgi:hypothetical protein